MSRKLRIGEHHRKSGSLLPTSDKRVKHIERILGFSLLSLYERIGQMCLTYVEHGIKNIQEQLITLIATNPEMKQAITKGIEKFSDALFSSLNFHLDEFEVMLSTHVFSFTFIDGDVLQSYAKTVKAQRDEMSRRKKAQALKNADGSDAVNNSLQQDTSIPQSSIERRRAELFARKQANAVRIKALGQELSHEHGKKLLIEEQTNVIDNDIRILREISHTPEFQAIFHSESTENGARRRLSRSRSNKGQHQPFNHDIPRDSHRFMPGFSDDPHSRRNGVNPLGLAFTNSMVNGPLEKSNGGGGGGGRDHQSNRVRNDPSAVQYNMKIQVDGLYRLKQSFLHQQHLLSRITPSHDGIQTDSGYPTANGGFNQRANNTRESILTALLTPQAYSGLLYLQLKYTAAKHELEVRTHQRNLFAEYINEHRKMLNATSNSLSSSSSNPSRNDSEISMDDDGGLFPYNNGKSSNSKLLDLSRSAHMVPYNDPFAGNGLYEQQFQYQFNQSPPPSTLEAPAINLAQALGGGGGDIIASIQNSLGDNEEDIQNRLDTVNKMTLLFHELRQPMI